MRIKIKIGACWLSGKYLGKHFRRRQYTEQVLLCNLHARYSCFWIIPAILLFIISYSFPTSVKIFLSFRIVDYLNIPGFSSDIEFLNEWVIHMNAVYPLENFEIDKFWEGKENELPLMWKASRSMWTPTSAADVERSFSILTLLDSPKRLPLYDVQMEHVKCKHACSQIIYKTWKIQTSCLACILSVYTAAAKVHSRCQCWIENSRTSIDTITTSSDLLIFGISLTLWPLIYYLLKVTRRGFSWT